MFITFEGPEGSGKSTAIQLIAEKLRSEGVTVLTTREPGAGDFGQQIRSMLLHGNSMPALSELFLFLADRANHVETIIRPALEAGAVVLCDRHADSTVVYQGARGLDKGMLRQLNSIATKGLVPDLTLLFDIEPSLGLSRIQDKDRLDREPLPFHEAVRQGFLDEMALAPDRWVKIDASASKETVFAHAWSTIVQCGASPSSQ